MIFVNCSIKRREDCKHDRFVTAAENRERRSLFL